VKTCQYDAYINRYDGLALGHWVNLVDTASPVTLTNTLTTVVAAGDGFATKLPSTGVAMALCDADAFNCWGWILYGESTTEMSA
jgi:hypothetical protein